MKRLFDATTGPSRCPGRMPSRQNVQLSRIVRLHDWRTIACAGLSALAATGFRPSSFQRRPSWLWRKAEACAPFQAPDHSPHGA
jgi:hypothetical protein